MRRLDYTRVERRSTAHTKNATEAVMALAHANRERQRLQQERGALLKRMHRIEARLTEIATTETRLMPLIQSGLARLAGAPVQQPGSLLVPRLPPTVAEVTLQY